MSKLYTWPDKDPDEVLDYIINWGQRLSGDKIVSSSFSVTSGSVEITASSFNDTVATVWLSDGSNNQTCKINNIIVTEAGRTMSQSVSIKVKTK